mmetsp:Transcript_33092/g.106191  ORF Transcript_33092/g.106191 Transcript_33092/m.106191 type:complete len:213 (-) Transcript_33092:35-673(-)
MQPRRLARPALLLLGRTAVIFAAVLARGVRQARGLLEPARDEGVPLQRLQRGRGVREQQRVRDAAVVQVRLEVEYRLDHLLLHLHDHAGARAALAVLPLRAGLEKGRHAPRVKVDETLVRRERERVRDGERHVGVGAREEDHVSGREEGDLARGGERRLLGGLQRRREEPVAVLPEQLGGRLSVRPDREQLAAAEVLADVGPADLVDVEWRA